MTLQVSDARDHDYVLMTADSSVYAQIEGGAADDSRAVPELAAFLPKKIDIVSDRVLATCGGCVALARDFRALMHRTVIPVDDFDVCLHVAREVVSELRADDRAGERYAIGPDATAVRGSIESDFTLVMTGFRRDGTTATATVSEGEVEDSSGSFNVSRPHGVPLDDVAAFYVMWHTASPQEALMHALAVHRILRRDHPSRVTADVSGVFLRMRGGPSPDRLTFSCDTTDLAAFCEVYSTIAGSSPADEVQAAALTHLEDEHRRAKVWIHDQGLLV